MAGLQSDYGDEEETGVYEPEGLGQATLALPSLAAGSHEFGPGADIHPVHIPMAPAAIGKATLTPAKPSLHEGGELQSAHAGSHGFDIYKKPNGKQVFYHYTEDGKPWFATEPKGNTDKIHTPEEVEFPPPSAVKAPAPAVPPSKPALHGSASPGDIIDDPEGKSIYYDTPKGYVIYNYDPSGKPQFAEEYNTDTDKVKNYAPHEAEFPSWVKVQGQKELEAGAGAGEAPKDKASGKYVVHKGAPHFATLDSAHYKAWNGGAINYHWNSDGKPWFADYLAPGAKYGEPGHVEYGPEDIHWPKKPSKDDLSKPFEPEPFEPEPDLAKSNWRAYNTYYEAHHGSFTPEEKEALKSGASTISGRLWKENLDQLDADRLERMRLLDSAFDKSSIPENLQTWSGVNAKVWQDLDAMEPGEIYLHKGYLSTSLARDIAQDFISSSSGGDYSMSGGESGLLRLHVPQGSRGIILGRLAPLQRESEVQLPRGVLLRKMAHADPRENVMDVEVVPGFGLYHGSASDFQKFDLGKAGSGEGTAKLESYTERPSVPSGAYLAESEKVGEKYRKMLAEEKLADPSGGWLYKIHVQAHPQELFDWNKPAREQSSQIRDILNKLYNEQYQNKIPDKPLSDLTGKDLLDALGPDSINKLRDAGVKGIRFLDKRSRQRGYGTQNYVIFDDNIMQVIGKKGASKDEPKF